MKKIFSFLSFFLAAVCVFATVDPLTATATVQGLISAGVGPLAIQKRMSYDRVKKLYPNFIISESAIRLEQVLTTGVSTYTFDPRNITQNQGATANVNSPLTLGVNDNDVFVVTDWRVFIDPRITAEQGRAELQTYPNQTAFLASCAAADVRDLTLVFNAQLNVTVGSTTFIRNYDCNRFLWIPQTQQAAATTWSQYEYDEFIPVEPLVLFSGKAENRIQLTLPMFAGAVLTASVAGSTNIVTFYAHGYTVQNGANSAVTEALTSGDNNKILAAMAQGNF